MSKELWKDIPGYEMLYQVSNLGNVKSLDRLITYSTGVCKIHKMKILSPGIRRGYYSVILQNHGVRKNFTIHRLVAKVFTKNKLQKPEVNHKDGNKLNNRATNLEWVTSSENELHAYRENLCSTIGEGHHKSKLTIKKVIEIRNLYKTGNYSYRKLASVFGVAGSTIGRVVTKQRWKHV